MMQVINVLFEHPKILFWLFYFQIGLIIWYVIYGLEKYMNGGSLGNGRWWVFKCFWNDLQWFLPGGLKRRTQYIRHMVRPRPNVHGSIGKYSWEEIRERNLYEEMARTVFGSALYFWGVDIILLFFLWPVMLCLFIGGSVLMNLVFCGQYLYSITIGKIIPAK